MRWMRDLMACLASNHTKHEHAQEKQSARAIIVTHSLTPHVQMAWLPPCSSMATCHTHLSLSLSLSSHTHTHNVQWHTQKPCLHAAAKGQWKLSTVLPLPKTLKLIMASVCTELDSTTLQCLLLSLEKKINPKNKSR